MNIVLFSNCAGIAISNMFINHPFTKDKFNMNNILNYTQLDKKLDEKHKQMLEDCDIFMYQPFNQHYTYSEYDISNIKKLLKPNCIILKVNYYRFKGFWYESEYKPFNSYNDYRFLDMKYYGLHNSFINFNGNMQDIITKINSITVDKEKFLLYFNEELNNLKKIDDNSDVKMYDYFINNYKKKHLFHDVFHPTNLFFYEVFRQIIFKLTGHILPYEDMEFIKLSKNKELSYWSLPILPQVKRILDMEIPDNMYIFNEHDHPNKGIYMNIYEYYYIRLSQTNFQDYLDKHKYENKSQHGVMTEYKSYQGDVGGVAPH